MKFPRPKSAATALGATGLAAVLLIVMSTAALASVREVTVGNFYYRDQATGSDGEIRIDVGDQIRFTVLDNGPGTPHTIELDEFDVSSGFMRAGETFTTPPLNNPGTYRIYCDPHENKGHATTLIVGSGTAPPPSPTPSPTPTATPTVSEPTNEPSPQPTTADPAPPTGEPSTETAPSAPPSEADPTDPNAGTPASEPEDPAPTGRGTADADLIAQATPDPGSLAAIIGTNPASPGPWTRSVWFALALLPVLLLIAGISHWRGLRVSVSPRGDV